MMDIDKIYSDYMAGRPLSDEEKLFLEEWRAQSKDNDRFDNDIRRLRQEGRQLSSRTPKDAVFGRIESAVRKKRGEKRLFRISAAAACIAVVSGLTFALTYRTSTVDVRTQAEAELILADGTRVALDPDGEGLIAAGDHATVLNSENTLIYDAAAEADEIVYHTIRVPRGKGYNLRLADQTKVYLNSGSQLSYPVTATGGLQEVYLSGEAYFEVSPNADRKFVVHAGDVAVEVLGTSFNVNAYPESNTVLTTLEKGAVQVRCGDVLHSMAPGKQVIYNKDSGASECIAVETGLYTSWKDGYYYFRQKPLGEIMEIIARWYDVEVSYDAPELRAMEFGGRLKRYEDLGYLLKRMEETRDIRFVTDGSTIMVKAK